MPRLFAVTRTRGPAWQDGRALEEQAEWPSHAAFMNGLHREGFILLGGPLDGTPDVLLIVRAEDEAAIRSRLAADSWTRLDLLRIEHIHPWTLRLGALDGVKT
jgi:uncharacterized protein YciI